MRWVGLVTLAAVLASPSVARTPPREPDRLAARAASITIIRDRLGIAHIRGASDADAVFGMAFAQAEDDFNRVETNYLVALGRLAEAEGEKAIWSDVRQRLWIDHDDLKRRYANSPPWLRAVMDGWADGLNHYLATHPTVRPRVLTRFEPWMALSFTEGSIGGDIEYVDLGALKALYDRGQSKAVAIRDFSDPQGSNGLALGRSRSVSGNPILLINPHTSFFFRDVVQVTSGEGLNVYGAVTWGQPFVYQGFNEHMGWMHTTSGLDNRDEFAVSLARLSDGKTGYRYGSEVRPLGIKPITVRFRREDGRSGERTVATYFTTHGPVIRADKGLMISLAIMNDPVKALEQSFRRTKARNLKEFMAVSALRANASNNTLIADASGNIAYLHPQFVPLRDHRVDFRGVIDGSNPRTAWRGLHTIDSLPNVINPKSGFVFNVNDAPWSVAGKDSLDAGAYPSYMDQYGSNPRTTHMLQLFDNDRKFTAAGVRDAAYDPANPGFDRLVPLLAADFAALPKSAPRRARLAAPVALLRQWDRRWSTESEAMTLAVFWGDALWNRAMGKDRPTNVFDVAYKRMTAPDGTMRLAALDEALAKMDKLYGGWRVHWGTVNRFQRNDGAIVQRFDDSKPSLPVGFAEPRWGSLAAFVMDEKSGPKRYGIRGNSFVAVVEFTPQGPEAMAVTAGGVSRDPTSPHFADQAQAYAEGRLLPVAFSAKEIAAQTVEVYTPGKRSR